MKQSEFESMIDNVWSHNKPMRDGGITLTKRLDDFILYVFYNIKFDNNMGTCIQPFVGFDMSEVQMQWTFLHITKGYFIFDNE